jgi:AcrR family transcriptional regulator
MGRAATVQKPRRRTQEERSDASRHQLIQSAINTIAELGLGNATILIIAKRARLTSGAVQHHFGTREALLVAILDEFGRKLAERVNRPLPENKPVEHRIAAILDETWELFTEPHFVSVTEILLASRSDRALHRIILAKTKKIAATMDARWVQVFADLNLTEERIRTTRRLAQAAMRGLALRANSWEKRPNVSAERALLQEVLINTLKRKA